MSGRFFARLFAGAIAALAVCASLPFAFAAEPEQKRAEKPPLVLYTAITTTTPQIPLWYAIDRGWPEDRRLSVHYWKNLNDLRGTMLAGKGDIWVGNLEGFAQAAERGAPVTLVAVTGWKKFYLVSSGEEPDAASLDALAERMAKHQDVLLVTPRDGPATGILESMKKEGGPAFAVRAVAPQQLMLEMLRGSARYALLPEPLLSLLMEKKRGLKVVASLEEAFVRHHGGEARLPLAGVAVNTAFARENPEQVKALLRHMQEAVLQLAADPKRAMSLLPAGVRETLGDDVIEASLARDLLHVEAAAAARRQIVDYLKMVLPEMKDTLKSGKMPSESFLWPE